MDKMLLFHFLVFYLLLMLLVALKRIDRCILVYWQHIYSMKLPILLAAASRLWQKRALMDECRRLPAPLLGEGYTWGGQIERKALPGPSFAKCSRWGLLNWAAFTIFDPLSDAPDLLRQNVFFFL
jgi:hypothetical protein